MKRGFALIGAGLAGLAITYFLFAYPTTELKIKGHTFKVKVARFPWQRAKGLAGTKKLNFNEGMLFLFPDKKPRTFWMKGINFGLDVIFIDGEKIVEIVSLPAPRPNQIPVYRSHNPADKVLELKYSICQRLQIEEGDKTIFSRLPTVVF